MKKRNLITSVVALALVSLLGIGATLAYLSDNESVTNTFTSGSVKIDLVEPDWDPDSAQDLEPGDVIAKNPAIVNTGRNDAYMMIKVEGADAMRAKDFEVYYDDVNWVLVDEDGKALDLTMVDAAASETGEEEAQLVDGYYVYVGDSEGVVAAGEATAPLFKAVYYTTKATGADFGEYTIKGILNDKGNGVSHYEIWKDGSKMDLTSTENSFDSYDAAADYIVAEDGLGAVAETAYTFDLVVSGYGIQAENLTFKEKVEEDTIYSWVAILLAP